MALPLSTLRYLEFHQPESSRSTVVLDPMRYFLFLLATAALFVRPAEIIPALRERSIYELLVLASLAASLSPVLRQLSKRALADNPITACVLGLCVAVVVSQLAQGSLYEARTSGLMFVKLVIYYLVLVAVIDSPQRLKDFLHWLLLFIVILAGVAILGAFHRVEIPGIEFCQQNEFDEATGEMSSIPRLQSTGIFHDPNDLAEILVAGVALGVGFAFDRTLSVLLRTVSVGVAGLLGWAVFLTQSRGGFMALLAAMLTLSYARWGWKRTVLAAAVMIPVTLVAFRGRITSFDSALENDTGQSRVQLWAEGLALLKQQPLFGIGCGEYANQVEQVAHNSFLHCFTELGLCGGSLFLGAFVAALWMLYRLRSQEALTEMASPGRTGGWLAAVTVGFIVSMFSLSRPYVVTPYLCLGLVTAHVRTATAAASPVPLRFDFRFLRRLAFLSVLFLIAMYLFTRIVVRWS